MIRLFAFAGLLMFGIGCAPDISETDFYSRHPEEVAPAGPLELFVIEDSGYSVRLSAEQELHAGYNKLFIEARKGDEPIQATLAVHLRYVSATASIDSPIPSIAASTDEQGEGEVGIYFVQPNGLPGQWHLENVYHLGAVSGSQTVVVEAVPDLWVQQIAGTDLYVSWVLPTAPRTGKDVLELAIHAFTGDRFAPVSDATIDLYPYMDMGGGDGHSTPYSAPVHVQDGRYRGEINFVMSGGWDMTAFISRGSASPDTVRFEGFTVQ